jgi:hypothetical protein
MSTIAGEFDALVAAACAMYPSTQRCSAGGCDLPACAVVIVVAAWSGPARAALTFVARTLRDTDARVPLLVVDHDVPSPPVEKLLGDPQHGWGEAAWVRDGRVLARVERWRWTADEAALVVEHTARITAPFGGLSC